MIIHLSWPRSVRTTAVTVVVRADGSKKGRKPWVMRASEEEDDAGHQGDKARAHCGGPRQREPASAPSAGRGSTLAAGPAASAVIIRLMTSSDMPMSMLMPATVRTNQ